MVCGAATIQINVHQQYYETVGFSVIVSMTEKALFERSDQRGGDSCSVVHITFPSVTYIYCYSTLKITYVNSADSESTPPFYVTFSDSILPCVYEHRMWSAARTR